MLRWLLPLVAVFALLGQAVTTYAAAGTVGEASCCCPVKAKCKCHDHDGKPKSSPTVKRCDGAAKLVAPAHVPAAPAISVEVAITVRVTPIAAVAPDPIPDDVRTEPETPPF